MAVSAEHPLARAARLTGFGDDVIVSLRRAGPAIDDRVAALAAETDAKAGLAEREIGGGSLDVLFRLNPEVTPETLSGLAVGAGSGVASGVGEGSGGGGSGGGGGGGGGGATL